jgi:hypothetical protein
VTLDPGDYYITVKGVDDGNDANACEGAYELTLTDLGTAGGGFIACDDNGVAETSSSALERTLTTGDYYLILKGKRPTDEGSYQLTVRDVGAVPSSAVACDGSTGSGDPARVQLTAQPGRRYYAVVKGDGPLDKGAFDLSVGDLSVVGGEQLGCTTVDPGTSSELTVSLPDGSYYAVLKGADEWSEGPYQLSIGAIEPETDVYDPATYPETITSLNVNNIRVATVLACDPSVETCGDARAQADLLAEHSYGAAGLVDSPQDTPEQVVRIIEQAAAADRIAGSLVFAPDLNPGFTPYSVEAIPDPGNRCTMGADGESFVDCAPGATPAFLVSLHNPLLAPVVLAANALGLYQFTLRVTTEREGSAMRVDDVPIYVRPADTPVAGSYGSGEYFQDLEATACEELTRIETMMNPNKPAAPLSPSWQELHYRADVHPDTSLTFYACGANTEEELDACDEAGRMARVLTVTAGSGEGTRCTAANQATTCPNGYCSPYSGMCQYLEGASCQNDRDCTGTGAGRCRSGPSAADPEIGMTCVVQDGIANPADALRSHDLSFMRMALALESGGDGSRTPSVFHWEARYHCKMTE